MTGENFKRINRKDERLQKMITSLDRLREEWRFAYHNTDADDYFSYLYTIEAKIEKLKLDIYTYVYNRNLNNYDYVKEFERKHLW